MGKCACIYWFFAVWSILNFCLEIVDCCLLLKWNSSCHAFHQIFLFCFVMFPWQYVSWDTCMSGFRWVPINGNDWYWIRHHIKVGMHVIVEILVRIFALAQNWSLILWALYFSFQISGIYFGWAEHFLVCLFCRQSEIHIGFDFQLNYALSILT